MSELKIREQFEAWWDKPICTRSFAQKEIAWGAWQAALSQRDALKIECYDAGWLSNFGGGDVEWWYEYIRAELARAHDFYQAQITAHEAK